MPVPSTRVNQLDATLLDQELHNQLLSQALSIFNKISPIHKTKYTNELEFILRSLMFKFTVWDKSQSYGLFLQNLKFKNLTRAKKVAYYTVFILGYYISQKLSPLIYSDDDTPTTSSSVKLRLWKVFKKLYIWGEKGYKLLSFVNFIDFLVTGRYQSLNLRLLNIKITLFSIELAKMNKGNVSFEFQNRQLIWNTFLEFIIFTLPIFQNSKFQSIFQRLLYPESPVTKGQLDKYAHLKPRQCAICCENKAKSGDYRITNAYKTNCGHVYCYVCILGKLEHAKSMDEKWNCLRCSEAVEWAKPNDDVDEGSVLFTLDSSDNESEEDETVEEKYERSVLVQTSSDEDDAEDYETYEEYGDDDLEEELEEAMDDFDEFM